MCALFVKSLLVVVTGHRAQVLEAAATDKQEVFGVIAEERIARVSTVGNVKAVGVLGLRLESVRVCVRVSVCVCLCVCVWLLWSALPGSVP
jgi:hypothetical protein